MLYVISGTLVPANLCGFLLVIFIMFLLISSNKHIPSYQSIPVNEWVHICFTWSTSSGGTLYVNGEKVTEETDLSLTSFPLGGYVTLAQVGFICLD